MDKITSQWIYSQLKDFGFFKIRIINFNDIHRILKHKSLKNNHLANIPSSSKLVLTALSYYRDEKNDLSTVNSPHGLIAPFARRNFYKYTVKQLKQIVRKIREITGLSKRDIQIFSNSTLPEKLLAEIAGIGFYGKNSLIYTSECGSMFVIGGFILPLPLANYPENCHDSKKPESLCGDCTICIDTCPANAISKPGFIDKNRCFQALSTKPGVLPEAVMEKWGKMIYGCQICQELCPLNNKPISGPEINIGNIGPSISLKKILANKYKNKPKNSVLDSSWIDPVLILRNAIIAAGNSGSPGIIPYLKDYLDHREPVLKQSANWALKKIDT